MADLPPGLGRGCLSILIRKPICHLRLVEWKDQEPQGSFLRRSKMSQSRDYGLAFSYGLACNLVMATMCWANSDGTSHSVVQGLLIHVI